MLGGTLWIAAGVALVSVMIGLPLGILRGMFSLPLPRLGSPVLIPFLTPPYISALSWMLALQRPGLSAAADRLAAERSAVQPQRDRAGDDLLTYSGGLLCRLPQPAGEQDPAGGGRPRPWRQRLARLLARDATDALSGAGGGMLLAFTLAIEEFGVPAALGNRAEWVMLTVGKKACRLAGVDLLAPRYCRCC